MQKIFQSNKEPLFGRADNIIKLSAFDLAVLATCGKHFGNRSVQTAQLRLSGRPVAAAF
jgi:hypothetical protein